MIIYYSIPTYAKQIVRCAENIGNQMTGQVTAGSQSLSNSWCLYFHSGQFQRKCTGVNTSRTFSCSSVDSQAFEGRFYLSGSSRWRRNPFTMKSFFVNTAGRKTIFLGLSSRYRKVNLSLSMPKQERNSKTSWGVGPVHWLQQGSASAGLGLGLSFCLSSSKPVCAEAPMVKNEEKDDYDSSLISSSHGKKVYTDYSITGIPGDGRCLFRSVAHGACIRSGKPSPSESLQRELADELRSKVADEFVKRREETEWFIEGDFDTYVSQIRKPHVWGGEPELFMASHVLQMPITVYMRDEGSSGLIAIAEYGQEYGAEDPIRVLYHGFGHYDALQIPGKKGSKSRL